ncbi:MAG: transcription elongation factor subunit Spt4 [Candidatus Bathyarchaeia archaeon]
MKEKACRNCHTIVYGNICPTCKETALADDFTGLLIVIDTERSEIAQKASISKPGRYALKVR